MPKASKTPGLGFGSPGGYWDAPVESTRSRRAVSPSPAKPKASSKKAAAPKYSAACKKGPHAKWVAKNRTEVLGPPLEPEF